MRNLKKLPMLVTLFAVVAMLLGMSSEAQARGFRGGYRGGYHGGYVRYYAPAYRSYYRGPVYRNYYNGYGAAYVPPVYVQPGY